MINRNTGGGGLQRMHVVMDRAVPGCVPNGKAESLPTPFEHVVMPFSGEIRIAA